jgi:hypothetical protein
MQPVYLPGLSYRYPTLHRVLAKVDIPTVHHQPTSELVDEDQTHTPRSSPHNITPSSPTLPTVSSLELLGRTPSGLHNPEPEPVTASLDVEIKLQALQGEQADETEVYAGSSLKRPRSLVQDESASWIRFDCLLRANTFFCI